MKELDQKIKNVFWQTPFLLTCSILLPVLAWDGFLLYPSNEYIGVWFQRSGSLMVLCAVWIEFKLFRINHLSNPISDNVKPWWDHEISDFFSFKYSKLISLLKFISATIAVIGTLIWGYGDSFYRLVH